MVHSQDFKIKIIEIMSASVLKPNHVIEVYTLTAKWSCEVRNTEDS